MTHNEKGKFSLTPILISTKAFRFISYSIIFINNLIFGVLMNPTPFAHTAPLFFYLHELLERLPRPQDPL